MKRLICLFFLLGVAYLLYYAYFLNYSSSLKKSDLLVIFSGAPWRREEGFKLAKKGLCNYITESGRVSLHLLEEYGKRNGLSSQVKVIKFSKGARTTFEDAYYTRQLLESLPKCDSIILVTSGWHMPRAYLLLRIELMGKNITIYPYSVKDPQNFNFLQIFSSRRCFKLFLLESLQLFTGIFVELPFSIVMGKSILDYPQIQKIRLNIKKTFHIP